MTYIGNNLTVQQYSPQIAYFSGNGTATSFTLPSAVVSSAQIIVTVANVIQNPSSAFTVSGTTLTFTSAPPSGTNNIWVEYTSLQTNTIAPSQGTVGPTQINSNYALWNLSGGNINYTSGNVGVGTASPSGPLSVSYSSNSVYNTGLSVVNSNSGSAAGAAFQLTNDAGNRAGGYLTSSTCPYYGGANTFNLGTVESIPFTFLTGNSERMRIDSSGNVLIGTTTSATYKLNVNSNVGCKGVSGNLNTTLSVTTGGAAGNFAVAGLIVVQGGIAGANFWDAVLYQSFGSPTVLGSSTYGSPSTRTYAGNGVGGLQVSLSGGSSGTYSINYIQISGS